MEEQGTTYIGVSAKVFIDLASEHLNSGQYSDGTRINPKFRESYGRFVESLREQRADARYYVFVYSRYFFIIIDF